MKFLLAATTLAFATLAPAQTVDEILAKNFEAKGGLAKIRAVQAMRITGKVTIGPGMDAPAVIEQKRGDKVRLDITFQGMTLTPMVLNGGTGWKLMPIQGNPNPESLSPEEMKDALEQADMDGFLVDYKSKGHSVEYLGKEKVEGTDAYKVKVTLKSGDVRTVYIDTDSDLEIKIESKSMRRGAEVEGDTILGDYKDVDGLILAHSIDSGQKGQPGRQIITVSKIEINPILDDARFVMPTKKEAPAPAVK
ncbi:MAG: hypothetical protein JJE39_06080 [Vicinamibacteria bacterium]|nr:hypothetical protein [Vicinamibacteria bacterium]